MTFLEKDLEEILFTSDRNFLKERGLHLPSILSRQVRIGNYGVADMVGYTRENGNFNSEKHRICYRPMVSIFELKQNKISVSTFLQAIRYAKGVKRYLSQRNYKLHNDLIIQVVLIGRQIDNFSSFVYLPDIINSDSFDLKFYTYDYHVDGIKFESHNYYSLTQEGFKL